MLKIEKTTRFKKDFKMILKRGRCDLTVFKDVVSELQQQHPLQSKYHDHPLAGQWKGFRECHLQPDWILIYTSDDHILVLTLVRTGTHADLFGK